MIWDGQYREIYINESETVPLIGMQLLRGYDLRIQATNNGVSNTDVIKTCCRSITEIDRDLRNCNKWSIDSDDRVERYK